MQAQKSLSAISANRDLWLDEYRYEVFERDRKSSIEAGEQRGFERGVMNGFQKGQAAGFQKGKNDTLKIVAQNLLKSKVLSIEEIADTTGLSVEEVNALAIAKNAGQQ